MTWVVDTGPLIHFAKVGWLGVLKMLAPGHRVVIRWAEENGAL